MDKKALTDILKKAVEEKIFPGAVVGITDGGGNRKIISEGRHRYEPDSPPMDESTVFDVASITKVLPTSMCALKALERGDLALDDRVAGFLPELATRYRDRITIRHLLTHTLVHDFRLSSLRNQPPAQLLESILSAEPADEPGARFFYSNTTSILLGLVIERLYKNSLDKLLRKEIVEPLGLRCTGFEPGDFAPREKIVATEIDPWRGRAVCGEVHDESAWVLRNIMFPGSAGLFSTVPDLLTFLGDLLAGASADKSLLLTRRTIDEMSKNRIGHLGGCTGLGWELNQDRYMGRLHSDRTIGKTGFTGCVIMADLTKGMGVALLANFTWPSRKSDPTLINMVRREIADAVFA